MKKLALALFAMTSFSVMAQTLDMDIQRKIERLSRLAQRGEVSRLSFMEQRELDQQLAGALRTLRDNDIRPNPNPGPGPMPGPGPIPHRPGRRFDTQATAIIGSNNGKSAVINLGGRNPGDILAQCTVELPRLGLSLYTKIIMTSNNNPYEQVSIFTYNANDVCTQIVNRMKPGVADWQFIDVSGTLSDNSNRSSILNLAGDRGEVLDQCLNQVKGSGLTLFTKLNVSVNRSPLRQKAIFTYSQADVCGELATMINSSAP